MRPISFMSKMLMIGFGIISLQACHLVHIDTKQNQVEKCKKNPSEANCLMYEETFEYPDGSNLKEVNPDSWKTPIL